VKKNGAELFAQLMTVDEMLVSAGHHPMSAWWRAEAERFCLSPATMWVACVGRGGAKTQELARWGATCTMFGPPVPPGERHWWIHLSENMAEATKSLLLYESYFAAAGFSFTRVGDEIRLNDAPRGVLCRPWRVGAASGFRGYGMSADEVAKSGGEADSPKDVIASATAMTVTHPGAPRLIFSSPTSRNGYFYELCERGTTEHQVFSTAPSWVANEGITEAQTHALEPDPATHSREYRAIAGDDVTGDWFGTSVEMMIEKGPREAPVEGVRYVHTQDPAETDFWGWAVGSHQVGALDFAMQTRSPSVVRIHESGSWKVDREPGAMLLRHKLNVLSRYPGSDLVYADQYAGSFVRQINRELSVRTEIVPWTGSGDESKLARCKAVRLAAYDGRFKIPDRPELIRQFHAVRSEFSSAGNERIVFPRTASGHLDELSAVILAGSILLSRRPDLAPSRASPWERRERQLQARRFALAFGAAGNFCGIGNEGDEP
jgi:hypothetical protein